MYISLCPRHAVPPHHASRADYAVEGKVCVGDWDVFVDELRLERERHWCELRFYISQLT